MKEKRVWILELYFFSLWKENCQLYVTYLMVLLLQPMMALISQLELFHSRIREFVTCSKHKHTIPLFEPQYTCVS